MSPAPRLRLVVGGDPATDTVPPVPPTVASERPFPVFITGRNWGFVHVVAVSLILHGGLIAASTQWIKAGEERAAGGSDDEIVIEGVDFILLDQMPSTAAALVEAPEITDADINEAPAETKVAAIAAREPVDIPTDRAAPVADDIAAGPVPIDGSVSETAKADLLPTDKTAQPIADLAATVPPDALSASEEVSSAGRTAPTPIEPTAFVAAPDIQAAETATLIEPAQRAEEPPATAVAVVEADTARTSDTGDGRRVEAAAVAPLDPGRTPTATAVAATEPTKDNSARKVETVSQKETSKSPDDETARLPAATAAQTIEDAAVAPTPPDARPDGSPAESDRLKPVEETTAVAAAEVLPEPPLPPKRPPNSVKPKTPDSPKTASKAAPSRPAVAAEPAARGPSKGKAGAGGKSKSAQGKAIFSNYQSKLVAHLRRYRSYPDAARRRRLQGSARVTVTINQSGRVVGVSLAGSSGHAILDREALAMVRRASPFPAIPSGLGKSKVSFRAPVRFNLR